MRRVKRTLSKRKSLWVYDLVVEITVKVTTN